MDGNRSDQGGPGMVEASSINPSRRSKLNADGLVEFDHQAIKIIPIDHQAIKIIPIDHQAIKIIPIDPY